MTGGRGGGWLTGLRRTGSAWLDLFYPPACALCFQRLEAADRVLCFRCRGALRPPTAWRCPQCGAAGWGSAPEPGRPCRLCPPDGASWRGALAVTGYFDLSAQCVYKFKYHRRVEVGEVMAELMAEHLTPAFVPLRPRIDCIAPVPLHWTRRMLRGFNQSHLLASRLAQELEIPCDPHLLRRRRYTRRQALVPHERRGDNVRDAFAVRPGRDLGGTGILLVDDVLTTGHTIQECARVLRQAGAREVWVACFARAGAGRPSDEDEWLQAAFY